MLASIRARLSYANVVATVALFVGLSGGAYAAVKLPRNSVGAKQLRRNAVTGIKIKNRAVSSPKIARNAVTGYHLLESTLAKVPTAADADHAAAADTATTASSAGNAALSRLDYESTVVSIPGGSGTATATASCPAGLYLTGGGARVDSDATAFVNDSGPLNRTTWESTGITRGSASASMTVYVICARAAAVTP